MTAAPLPTAAQGPWRCRRAGPPPQVIMGALTPRTLWQPQPWEGSCPLSARKEQCGCGPAHSFCVSLRHVEERQQEWACVRGV